MLRVLHRVAVTGASGLVGTWLRRLVPPEVEMMSWTHRSPVEDSSVKADLRYSAAVDAGFAATRPSVVIHSAMALDVESIVDATENVARGASAVGADVVYISTDAVFSGDGRPGGESALPEPVWDYGRWKAKAERIVLRGSTKWTVVRLPLVVSLDPEDRAVERITEGAIRREPTRWYSDEIRQPAMAPDIAQALWRITRLDPAQRSGIWQLPGPEHLSRYEIAQRVVRALKLDPGCIMAVPTPRNAGRPRHINMLGDRAQDQIGWEPSRILGLD